jgi:hypothetical protein
MTLRRQSPTRNEKPRAVGCSYNLSPTNTHFNIKNYQKVPNPCFWFDKGLQSQSFDRIRSSPDFRGVISSNRLRQQYRMCLSLCVYRTEVLYTKLRQNLYAFSAQITQSFIYDPTHLTIVFDAFDFRPYCFLSSVNTISSDRVNFANLREHYLKIGANKTEVIN